MPNNTINLRSTTAKAERPARRAKRKASSSRAVTWTGIERTPRKRWWWWVTTIYLALLVVVIAATYDQWVLAVLTTVMTAALLVAYGSKPRPRQYRLNGTTLTIDNASFDLTRFNRAVVEDPWTDGKSTAPGLTMLLLPKARLGVPLSVFLPDDEAQKEAVIAALTRHLAPTGGSSYLGVLRFFDRIARWLRLQ